MHFSPVVVTIAPVGLVLAQGKDLSMSHVRWDASFSLTLEEGVIHRVQMGGVQCLIRSGEIPSIFRSFAAG